MGSAHATETPEWAFRSDGSGTSFLFTNKLNTACNGTWKPPYNKDPYQDTGKGRVASWSYGANQNWQGQGSSGHRSPNFIGESGNPGVVAGIQANKWGTGYAEGAWVAAAPPGSFGTLEQSSLLDTSGTTFVKSDQQESLWARAAHCSL